LQIVPLALELRTACANAAFTLASPTNRDLLYHAVGSGGSPEGFLYGGFTVYAGIRASLTSVGRDLADFKTIVDFGCGSGRISRWFQSRGAGTRLFGFDISSDAISWCRQNLPFGSFVVNHAYPPLPLGTETVDLVVGVSVLTHLNEELQLAWLHELSRICRPGGIVLLTVHDEEAARTDLSSSEFTTFASKGFLYKAGGFELQNRGLPSFYQVAFHSRPYIARTWTKWFRLLGYVRHGPFYRQQLIVLEKRASDDPASDGKIVSFDLPLAALDAPTAGGIVSGRFVHVTGWAFEPRSGPVPVGVCLDGAAVVAGIVKVSRPDVLSAHRKRFSPEVGFSTDVPMNGQASEPHVVLITDSQHQFPLCATYFWEQTPE
jgi:SAM-dependent methyltransferase